MTENNQLLVDAWNARNELYRKLFGQWSSTSPPKYAPPIVNESSSTSSTAETSAPDDDDVRLSVLCYGPDPLRPHWTYITAGLSNPWYQEAPAEVSGFGMELLIKTPQEALWPAQVLRTMAFYVFNHAATLSPGARVALNAPVSVYSPSDLTNLIVWYADDAPECWYQLPSGGFGIFSVIGVSDDECRLAESIEEHGTWCIQEVLRQTGVGQITDPSRQSVMQRQDVGDIIRSVRTYAENFPSKFALPE